MKSSKSVQLPAMCDSRSRAAIWGQTTEVRSLYVVIFDKSGKSLSGWHYEKLREFGVQEIRNLRAVDITHDSAYVRSPSELCRS
jgi:hypothetical protein